MQLSDIEVDWSYLWNRSRSWNWNNKEILIVNAISIAIFIDIYVICYLLCNKCSKTFKAMTFNKKSEYVARILSIVHAIIAVILSVIGMLYFW